MFIHAYLIAEDIHLMHVAYMYIEFNIEKSICGKWHGVQITEVFNGQSFLLIN